jgi:hypothetical protein
MTLIHVYDRANPVAKTTTQTVRGVDDARLREANEFELDGLVSDDEDEERAARRKLLTDDGLGDGGSGPSSPSTVGTVGRNSDRVVA